MQFAEWGEAWSLEYYWQETLPDIENSGTGVIHYDGASRCYALYNRFANTDRELGYILHAAEGRAWVFERRDEACHCSRHGTDRQVFPPDLLAQSKPLGEGLVLGERVTLLEFREPGDHDRWLWCLDARGLPLRFYTWTHHGDIQVLHDLIGLRQVRPRPEVFAPPAGYGCGPD